MHPDALTFKLVVEPRDSCRLADSISMMERVAGQMRSATDVPVLCQYKHWADELDGAIIRLKSLQASFQHIEGHKGKEVHGI